MKIKFILLFAILITTVTFSNAQKEIWGMTKFGGKNDGGVIFKTDADGNNFQTVFSFPRPDGREPLAGLTENTDGKLYGVTASGGNYNCGTIYEFDPATSIYTKKVDFDTLSGIAPNGYLFLATDENFYGMTIGGGANGFGTIFKYNPAVNTIVNLFDFNGFFSGEAAIGSFVQAANGKLYGTTLYGGANTFGVMFTFDPVTLTYNKILDFDGTNGKYPREGMLLADSGMLYGTAGYGGTHGFGVLYKVDPVTNNYSIKYEFDNANIGSPEGYLMQASNGLIYGVSEFGNNTGQLFEFNPLTDSLVEKNQSFTIGMRPNGRLTEISNGILLGMTLSGGTNNAGVIYEYNIPLDSFSIRYDFDLINGSGPYGCSLIRTTSGKLIGPASNGGIFDGGTLFEFDPTSNQVIKKHDFDFSPDGIRPSSSFILGTTGKLYSMTLNGGVNNEGVIFQFDPLTSIYTKLFDFNRNNFGAYPEGSLVEASNGKLYGMTSAGGVNDDGVIFEYDPVTFNYAKLRDFDSTITGKFPLGSLIIVANDLLYGLTNEGGINNSGILFEYNISTNALIKKFDFDGTANGSNPGGSLLKATDYFLYGLTSMGGLNNKGVIFKYHPLNDIMTKLFDFDGMNSGSIPMGSLIQSTNNNLYGLTTTGGLNGDGVVFEYNITGNTFNKINDFNSAANAYDPQGTLLEASNGNFYAATYWGGQNDDGVLFEYNLALDTIQNKFEFANGNCRSSQSDLIEIDLSLINYTSAIEDNFSFDVFPNPTTGKLFIQLNNFKNGKCKIVLNDITGRIVYENDFENIPDELSLGGLTPGMYIITLILENKNVVKRISLISK